MLLLIQEQTIPRFINRFIFTLHFATINTAISLIFAYVIIPFTLHFATINTDDDVNNVIPVFLFTLHFATINTSCFGWNKRGIQ